jgi:hypothetical protein
VAPRRHGYLRDENDGTVERARLGERATSRPSASGQAARSRSVAIAHGLALLEIRGYLGDEIGAAQHWRQTIAAALAGYQAPSPTG